MLNASRESSRIVFALVIAVFMAMGTVNAQTTAGSINGQVLDATGAAVVGAVVTATNQQSGAERTSTTIVDGTYTIPGVRPGLYRVTASATGFQTAAATDVRVLVNTSALINFTLQVGAVTETVEVQAAAPQLQTGNSTVGEVIENTQMVQLPLNGRQFTQLALLAPGAAYKESGQQGLFNIKLGAGGVSPSVNGQNSHHNNFTLDGLENNSRFDNVYAVAPPPDAIQEFKVQTHIADARFGMAPGANINVVTKSGTSEYHGAFWEFLRNDKLDARNFFDFEKRDPTGQQFAPTKSPFRQNQYGLTAGGPFWPGANTFFFGYWEGYRSRKSSTLFASVPPTAQLAGDFSGLGRTVYDPATTQAQGGTFVREPFPNNQIPTSRMDQAAIRYGQHFYPAPNYGGGNLPAFPNLISGQSRRVDSDQFGVRVDHHFANNNFIFGRANFVSTDSQAPQALPTLPLLQENPSQSVMLGYTHLFSPTFIANAKFGYLRTRIPIYPKPAGTALVDSLGFESTFRAAMDFADQNDTVGPQISIAPTLTTISQYGWGLGNPDYNYQYNFDVTSIRGRHTLTAGISFMHWRHLTGVQPQVTETFNNLATNDPSSQSGGDGLASYLLGLPSNANQFGFNPTDIWGKIFQIFVQDDWKVTPKLTLNLGLQYDYAQRPRFFKDEISTVDLVEGIFRFATVNPFTGEPPNLRSTLFDPDWNNFAPRIGIAYQLAQKTVIRTGFAVFYAHANELIQEGRDSTSQWPYGPLINQTAVNLNNAIPTGRTFLDPLPPLGDLSIPRPPNFGVDVRMRDPYSLQWNFGIQQALSESLSAEAAYVAASNNKLFIQPTANVALFPAPGNFKDRQPFPALNPGAWDTHIGRSNYHSLQLKLTKRFAQGVSFLGSYTWGRSFDFGTTRGSQAQNFYDLLDSYGPSDFDVPQHFVFSYVYDLPFLKGNRVLGGWQVSGVTRYSHGTPFSIGAPFDVANVGGGSQRGSLVPGQELLPSGFKQSNDGWFNPAAVQIVPFTYGNLSRNILRAPGIKQWDIGIFKSFQFAESLRLEFRTELFNAFNTAQFGNPVATATNPSLGRIFGTRFDSREIQFGLKLLW